MLTNDEDKKENTIDISLLSDAQRFNMRRLGLSDKVSLVSYCLMPNHFHLLLYQHEPDAITQLMRSIATGYSLYFNKRYDRVGSLFQGVYKASRIDSDAYWWHISRYIHLNPLDLGQDYKTYDYSSYAVFSGNKVQDWVKPDLILDGFRSTKAYEKFVEDYIPQRNELESIKHMLANGRELP